MLPPALALHRGVGWPPGRHPAGHADAAPVSVEPAAQLQRVEPSLTVCPSRVAAKLKYSSVSISPSRSGPLSPTHQPRALRQIGRYSGPPGAPRTSPSLPLPVVVFPQPDDISGAENRQSIRFRQIRTTGPGHPPSCLEPTACEPRAKRLSGETAASYFLPLRTRSQLPRIPRPLLC